LRPPVVTMIITGLSSVIGLILACHRTV
jgi:hypothetical protein